MIESQKPRLIWPEEVLLVVHWPIRPNKEQKAQTTDSQPGSPPGQLTRRVGFRPDTFSRARLRPNTYSPCRASKASQVGRGLNMPHPCLTCPWTRLFISYFRSQGIIVIGVVIIMHEYVDVHLQLQECSVTEENCSLFFFCNLLFLCLVPHIFFWQKRKKITHFSR